MDHEDTIFHNALRLGDTAERSAYLDLACTGDADLRAQVERRLAEKAATMEFQGGGPASSAPQGPLTPQGVEPPLPAQPLDLNGEGVGDSVGPYKILQKIGEGGFGVVYMAEQRKPMVRKVALKVIKLGMDTREVIARFEAERQALAIMDHQHIAKVLDAGATRTGRPYFVMELVKGVPITEFCDEHCYTAVQRIELFIEVCAAVQHAHQKGIIHRDLKPSNILIALDGARAIPKVIDFGIAKATQQRLTDKTLFTQVQQFVGTPAYISPEQSSPSSLDIDTRSDIYSLGVVLFELLTGKTPLDASTLARSGYEEMRRMIREVESPRPSAQLRSLPPQELQTIARCRSSSPGALGALLRGDLDLIVHKALEKDRVRRYETANGLAMDLRRYLNDEPVSAVGPTVGYRFLKFVRRNRTAVSVAAAIFLLLVAGITMTSSLYLEALDTKLELKKLNVDLTDQLDSVRKARAAEQKERLRAERNMAVSLSMRSRLEREHPQRRTLLATEAVNICLRTGLPTPVAVEQSLREALAPFGGRGLGGHSEAVVSMQISADSRWLVTGSWDHTACIWDLNAADPSTTRRILAGHSDEVRSVAISEDGRWIATAGGRDRTARLWSLTEDGPLTSRTLPGHAGIVIKVIFSPDGSLLFSGAEAGIRVWDLRTEPPGQLIREHEVENFELRTLALSPNGRWLAVAGPREYRSIHIWDLESTNPLELARTLEQGREVIDMDFSPDSNLLAAVCSPGSIHLWNLADEDVRGPRHVLDGPESGYFDEVTISPDGRWLAAGSQQVYLHDLKAEDVPGSRRILSAGIFERDQVFALVFSPDSRKLIAGTAKGTLHVWNLGGSGLVPDHAKKEELDSSLYELAASPDGRWVAAGSAGGQVRLWSLDNSLEAPDSTLTWPLLEPQTPRKTLLSPDGRWLVQSSNRDLSLKGLSPRKPEEAPSILTQETEWPTGIDPTGRWLITRGRVGDRVRDLEGPSPGTDYRKFGVPLMDRTTFSANGRWVSTHFFSGPGRSGPVHLWDLEAASLSKPVHTIPETTLWTLAVGPAGRWVVLGGAGADSAWLYDTKEARRRLEVTTHESSVVPLTAAISADGRWLALKAERHDGHLWNLVGLDSGARPMILRGHRDAINRITMSPDSRWLLTAGHDRDIRVFDLKSEDPSRTVAVLAGHTEFITSLRVSRDSRWVFSMAGEEIGLWDLNSPAPEESGRLIKWLSNPIDMAVTPGNDELLILERKRLRRWPLHLPAMLREARALTGRNFSQSEWDQYFPGETYRRVFTDLSASPSREN